jgi:hypothetical protein
MRWIYYRVTKRDTRTLLLLFSTTAVAFAETPCEQLKSLTLPDTVITAAESVSAGQYRPAGFAPARQPTITSICTPLM